MDTKPSSYYTELDRFREPDMRTKRPILKDLYKYFIPLYAAQWEDIGVNLDIDLGHLEIIKVDNPNNVRRRCQILLQSWLRVDPDATWDKLFTAIDDCASSISAEHFKKYLEKAKRDNETEKYSLYKLVIFGPPRVGKSSLFEVLLGKIPKKNSESTGICDRLIFKVAITKDATGVKSTWHKIKIEDEIARLHNKLKKKQELQNPEKLLAVSVGHSEDSVHSLEVVRTMNELSAKNQSHEEIHYTDTLMVCYDSGGQPEFFDVMPSLATNPTGYIMVVDMSKDLNELIQSKVLMRGEEVTLPKKITCMDLLKNAITSIQSGGDDELSHNLLVVGTHLDQCKSPEENIPKLDEQIYMNIMKDDAEQLFRGRKKNKNKRNIDRTQIIHPIANLFECTENISLTESQDRDSIAQEIRTAIEDMAKSDNIQKELPINWLLFQLETQLKVAKGYISRSTCKEYAEKCNIKENEIDAILSYFHALGVILYYKNCVRDIVFSPQWLFNRLSDIIFEKYNKKCPYKAASNIKKGRIEKQFLVDLYQGQINGPLTIDHLLTIFEDQFIMAEYPNNENMFFMPALLDPDPERFVDATSIMRETNPLLTVFGKRIYERLYVKFEKQYFPRSIFCSVATQFMKMKYSLQEKLLYNNVLVFLVPHSNEYIGLFDCKTVMAIEMYKKNDKNDENLSELPHCLSGLLYQFLTVSCEKVQIDCNFKFGFTCDCSHFAGVEFKCPFFLPEKICKSCGNSNLKYDELVWITSPKTLINILSPQNLSMKDVEIKEPGCSGHSTTTSLDRILRQKPEMADINKIVVPHIQAEWEDFAFDLRYEIAAVKGIKANNNQNPKKCCKELFIDWLSTDHGVGPKTWETLIKKLKENDDLAAATSTIINKLKELADSNSSSAS